MSKSRKRRPRSAGPDKARARRRSRPRDGHRRRVATLRPGQDLTPLLTPDDVAHLMSAVDAAARGDIKGAIHHELSGLMVEGSLTVPRLYDLLDHDPAPAWAFSRWCVSQAMRWMLVQEDPRVDEATRMTLALTHADHLPSVVDDTIALGEYATLVAATDWVCSQLAVYEYGGLADFVVRRADAALLEKCDLVENWAEAPMSVYSYLGTDGPDLVLRDLVVGADLSVLNLGAMSERDRDVVLMGRVVPIATAPGLMFESRPLSLDMDTAADAVVLIRDDPWFGWLIALSDARGAGRLDRGFSCHDKTLFTSDLTVLDTEEPGTEPAPRIQEMIGHGLSPHVANAVGVLEVGLIAAEVSPDALAVVTPHVVAAMSVPGAFEGALRECTALDRAEGWERLAGVTYGAVADRCRDLARECRAA